jgi:hypothetical protein
MHRFGSFGLSLIASSSLGWKCKIVFRRQIDFNERDDHNVKITHFATKSKNQRHVFSTIEESLLEVGRRSLLGVVSITWLGSFGK